MEIPIRAAFADREKNRKSLVSGDGSAAVVEAARVVVAAVVMATMVVVLVSPLTLYRPSARVLIHFVLKLIFPKNKKTLKNS